ncbi:ankyrin [Wilcoxina mikolae CBS 423.85]|nr:ankyrin [Wilcoxina mikolae CBS 423.85]
MACLDQLIPELILQITDHLETRDVFFHGRICVRFQTLLGSILLKSAVTHVHPTSGQTPLHWAVKNDRFSVASDLLAHGAAASPRDNTGTTPLHNAVPRVYVRIPQLLLSHGAEVNASCRKNSVMSPEMPIQFATFPNIAVLLIDHGADLRNDRIEGLLLISCLTGRSGLVRLLLDRGGLGHA